MYALVRLSVQVCNLQFNKLNLMKYSIVRSTYNVTAGEPLRWRIYVVSYCAIVSEISVY